MVDIDSSDHIIHLHRRKFLDNCLKTVKVLKDNCFKTVKVLKDLQKLAAKCYR
jgi:hypothetical protein